MRAACRCGCRPKTARREPSWFYRKRGAPKRPRRASCKKAAYPRKNGGRAQPIRYDADENLDPPYKRLIASWSYAPENTVLDPFAGQGMIALAARALERRSISVELNPDSCRQIVSLLAEPHMPCSSSSRRR